MNPYAGRTFVVLNPAAGQDDPARGRRQIGGALAVRGAGFDLMETSGPGDAERLAREAANLGYCCVAAAGGDGTIAEVITGLAGGDTPLGILPLGTGNQLAANLGIPLDLERAVEVLVNGEPTPIDLGQLGNGRYFAIMAGAGWDAEVMSMATRELKERWGFGAYLFAGLRKAVTPSSALFRITADDLEFEVSAATVLIANVGQLVHSLLPLELRIGPGVSFHDGLLDVCIFAPRNVTDVAAVLWRVARRRYVGDERLIDLQAREIRVETEPPILTQVDGDLAGDTPLVARAVPGGVRVMLPR
ncbi:MAG TPA: diacylglycerol kinase family protein [Longimicrobiaceae bacterium]|nr:diacylglycerol kinase family protein [Longimicrobiaceae bacterium]